MDAKGNLLVADGKTIRKLGLEKGVVRTFRFAQRCDVHSLATTPDGNIIAGCKDAVYKLVSTWSLIRFLWIGHLKENATVCLLATLPRDIIKEIASYIFDSKEDALWADISD
mmetsp:Transcript_28586/g.40299  ORF Transcript_28586/g.40299 Transcript_28586/m.40299 type:complete len:112 (-) Transcript_28586:25-360(-)